MRDSRFVAEHRGGPLTKDRHLQLMEWAYGCAEHVMEILGESDGRLAEVLAVARAWMQGKASVGEARKASVAAIAVARGRTEPSAIAVARAVGHAAAVAHMADHALGPALYGLRALKAAGRPVAPERQWQRDHLPPEVRDLVLTTPKYTYIERV